MYRDLCQWGWCVHPAWLGRCFLGNSRGRASSNLLNSDSMVPLLGQTHSWKERGCEKSEKEEILWKLTMRTKCRLAGSWARNVPVHKLQGCSRPLRGCGSGPCQGRGILKGSLKERHWLIQCFILQMAIMALVSFGNITLCKEEEHFAGY